jgi:predicted transcriptional regulator
VVAGYVSHNHVAASSLPALIASVHAAIDQIALGQVATPAELRGAPTPAEIRRSVQSDAIISFLDGKPYQTLKRHLTKHGLDPKSYRSRFGLPADYPMVTASYSERRSGIAKAIRLGLSSDHAERRITTRKASKG